jgi:hypothetical protein
VESIGNKAFEDCRNLTSIIVPNSVKSIGNEAFSYCNGLSSITIGSGVKIIGDYAYSYCSNLKDVYCYAESVPTTASNAFYGTMIYDGILYVPASSIDSYRAVKPWGTFRKIVAITKN